MNYGSIHYVSWFAYLLYDPLPNVPPVRISLKIRMSGISRFYAQSRAFKHAAAVLNEQLQLFSRIPFPELVGSLLPTQMAQ